MHLLKMKIMNFPAQYHGSQDQSGSEWMIFQSRNGPSIDIEDPALMRMSTGSEMDREKAGCSAVFRISIINTVTSI